MATYNLQRFAQPAVLKAMAPKRLHEFLGPYQSYSTAEGCRCHRQTPRTAWITSIWSRC